MKNIIKKGLLIVIILLAVMQIASGELIAEWKLDTNGDNSQADEMHMTGNFNANANTVNSTWSPFYHDCADTQANHLRNTTAGDLWDFQTFSLNWWEITELTDENNQCKLQFGYDQATEVSFWRFVTGLTGDTDGRALFYNNNVKYFDTSNYAVGANWVMQTLIVNSTGSFLFKDGAWVLNRSEHFDLNDWDKNVLNLCYSPGQNKPFDGGLDEIKLYNHSLSGAEMTNLSLFNYNTPPPVAVAGIESNLSVFFQNETASRKSTFDEGENFLTFINWTRTNNGSAITPTQGNCTMTLENGISENESTTTNFLICDNPACAFSTIKEEFTAHSKVNAIEDQLRVKACHPQLIDGDISASVQCGSNGSNISFEASLFPPCASGFGTGLLNLTTCLNYDVMNVTLQYLGLANRRKLVLEYEMDREYSQHIIDEDELNFNITSGFWESKTSHEYYVHGIYQINTTCVSENSSLNNIFNTTLTIVNVAPRLFFKDAQTTQGFYDYASGIPIEFGVGNFTFFGAVVDDDLDYLNVSFYNSSGHFIYSIESNTPPFPSELNLSSDLFLDFLGNPYNITAWANDTTGANTTISVLFNVTDTGAPICTGLTDANNLNGTNFTFNSSCYDENFFSYNLTCNNGFNNVSLGLNVQNFNFVDTFLQNGDVLCSFRYCDGHTLENLSIYFIERIRNSSIIVSRMGLENVFTPITDRNRVAVSKTLDSDRVRFRYDYETRILPGFPIERSFYYETSLNSYYLPSDKYKGWIVDYTAGTWFDSNIANDPDAKVTVRRFNSSHWLIDVYSDQNYLEFESIGELNCVAGSFTVTATYPAVVAPLGTVEFTSTPQALFYIMLFTIWIVFLVMCFKVLGKRQKVVQFFNFVQLFVGIVLGFSFFAFSSIIGILVIGVSLAMGYGLMRDG